MKNSAMVKYSFITFILLGVLGFAHANPKPAKMDNDTAIQNAVLVQINQYRKQHGLSQLKMDDRIVKEARQHSLDMANHKMPFGHTQFSGRIKRLHAQIKDSNAGAENVAYNYKDAQDVVKNWLRSPGHKRNIDGHYNLTGVGVVRDSKGKLYFTQIFLRTGPSPKYVKRTVMPHVFSTSFFRIHG